MLHAPQPPQFPMYPGYPPHLPTPIFLPSPPTYIQPPSHFFQPPPPYPPRSELGFSQILQSITSLLIAATHTHLSLITSAPPAPFTPTQPPALPTKRPGMPTSHVPTSPHWAVRPEEERRVLLIRGREAQLLNFAEAQQNGGAFLKHPKKNTKKEKPESPAPASASPLPAPTFPPTTPAPAPAQPTAQSLPQGSSTTRPMLESAAPAPAIPRSEPTSIQQVCIPDPGSEPTSDRPVSPTPSSIDSLDFMAALLDEDQHLPSLIVEARRLKKKHKKKDKKKRKPTPAAPASAPTDPSPAPSPTPSMAVLCTDALLKHRAGTRLASSSAPTGSQIQRIKKAPAPAASAPAPTDPSPTPSPAPMLAPSPTPPSPDDLWLQRHDEARLWQQQVSACVSEAQIRSLPAPWQMAPSPATSPAPSLTPSEESEPDDNPDEADDGDDGD